MTFRTTVAAPFRHLRKAALKKSELVYYYALDRRWMSTEQAAELLKTAEEDGLLVQEGGFYKPAFDPATISIPVGFRPTSAIFEKRDALDEMVHRVSRAAKMDETEVVAEMNRLIKEGFDGNLLPGAAIAIIARRHNVPFDDCVPALQKSIKKDTR